MTTTAVFIFYWFLILKYNYLVIRIITTMLYILYITAYLTVFLGSPGIPGKEYYKDTFKFEKEEDKVNYQKCSNCNIIIPKSFRVVHCQKCQVCIINQDHHCPWTGKCIGQRNIIFFYIFLTFLLCYMFMSFITFISFLIKWQELEFQKMRKIKPKKF
jgi:hypothetical protein